MSTLNIPFFTIKVKDILYYPKSAAMEFFPRDLVSNMFETAVVIEPSVLEPLKFY